MPDEKIVAVIRGAINRTSGPHGGESKIAAERILEDLAAAGYEVLAKKAKK